VHRPSALPQVCAGSHDKGAVHHTWWGNPRGHCLDTWSWMMLHTHCKNESHDTKVVRLNDLYETDFLLFDYKSCGIMTYKRSPSEGWTGVGKLSHFFTSHSSQNFAIVPSSIQSFYSRSSSSELCTVQFKRIKQSSCKWVNIISCHSSMYYLKKNKWTRIQKHTKELIMQRNSFSYTTLLKELKFYPSHWNVNYVCIATCITYARFFL
jgi:hypothetical protein